MEFTAPFRCASTRRSVKFQPGLHARHFLAFDPAISKHDRMILFVELLAQAHRLADISDFELQKYAPEQNVELRVLTDPRHPAFGQIGLFAKKTIPTNTVVTPYTGFIEIFATSCSSRNYTMGFGYHGDDYALDAEFAGNYGRFANDPRGVEGLSANISAKCHFTARGEAYTALVSRRVINKGEEILMSYGKKHSLRASPWIGLKGEILTCYRAGTMTPFPQVGKRTRHSPNNSQGAPTNDGSNGHSRIAVEHDSNKHGSLDIKHESQHEETHDDASMELLWECPQCGTWSVGSPTPVRVDHCIGCRSPRLRRARLVALRCASPLTRAEILRGVKDPTLAEESTSQDITGVHNEDHDGNGDEGDVAHSGASEHVDWPLNVPFLPWQVWDAAIPPSAVTRHARFESQENLFLYKVNFQEEDLPTRRRGRQEQEEQQEQQEQSSHRGRKPRVRRRIEELWPVDEDTLVNANITTTSKVTQCAPRAQSGECTMCSGVRQGGGAVEYLFHVKCPISAPLRANCQQMAQQDHRFEKDNNNGEVNVKEEEAEKEKDEEKEKEKKEESIREARASLKTLLNGISRRVFTDRAYRRGEVVAAVGGTIRAAGDPRRRPDASVLEIPMRYFVPAALRRGARAGSLEEKEKEKSEEMPHGSSNSSGSDDDDDDAAMLLDLCQRLDDLSLVVTNEMMYCPCLVTLDEAEDDRDAVSQKGNCGFCSPLELCNVCLVLTVDALGSPYVAAVAVRDILPYEPLLACVGCSCTRIDGKK